MESVATFRLSLNSNPETVYWWLTQRYQERWRHLVPGLSCRPKGESLTRFELCDNLERIPSLIVVTRKLRQDRCEVVVSCMHQEVVPAYRELCGLLTQEWSDADSSDPLTSVLDDSIPSSRSGRKPYFHDEQQFENLTFPIIQRCGRSITMPQLCEELAVSVGKYREPSNDDQYAIDKSTLYRAYKRFGYRNFAAVIDAALCETP